MEFQILLRNLKTFKKIDILKVYLFRLLEVYFINNLMQSILLTSDNS